MRIEEENPQYRVEFLENDDFLERLETHIPGLALPFFHDSFHIVLGLAHRALNFAFNFLGFSRQLHAFVANQIANGFLGGTFGLLGGASNSVLVDAHVDVLLVLGRTVLLRPRA
jgi:hypothetical protein